MGKKLICLMIFFVLYKNVILQPAQRYPTVDYNHYNQSIICNK